MSVSPADGGQSRASGLSRRHFLAEAGTAALALSVVGPQVAQGASAKVDLGIIGCGGRGSWIADLFQKHGGYNIVAAADYFPDRVNGAGRQARRSARTALHGALRLSAPPRAEAERGGD